MYTYHCSNLRAIQRALKSCQLVLRSAISEERDGDASAFTCLFSHLVTTWIEVRLLKLCYEHNAFQLPQRDHILGQTSLERKWLEAVDIAFCNSYGILWPTDSRHITAALPFTPRKRYDAIIDTIKTHLARSAQLRNRIAHGQWMYTLTSDLKSVSTELMRLIKTENIVVLQLRHKIFTTLSQIIHDLSVSTPTFERDFDKHYAQLECQLLNSKNRLYKKYQEKMIAKHQRGLEKRRRLSQS